MVPQGDTNKMINLQNKMAVKVTKKVKYAIVQNKCYKEYILHGKFHAFSKSAQLLDYATLLILY